MWSKYFETQTTPRAQSIHYCISMTWNFVQLFWWSGWADSYSVALSKMYQRKKDFRQEHPLHLCLVSSRRYFSLQATCPQGFSDKVRFLIEGNICQESGPSPTCFDLPLRVVLHILERVRPDSAWFGLSLSSSFDFLFRCVCILFLLSHILERVWLTFFLGGVFLLHSVISSFFLFVYWFSSLPSFSWIFCRGYCWSLRGLFSPLLSFPFLLICLARALTPFVCPLVLFLHCFCSLFI